MLFCCTMIITSFDNPKIVEIAKLADKKYRKRSGLYVIEGYRLVTDAQKYGADIAAVYVRQSVAEQYSFADRTVVADRVFDKLCDTVNGQGVLAVVRKQTDKPTSPTGNSLVLDGLQDPGNVGTLIRTAAACGFSDVYAANSADLYSPKVLRSAMSAHFCVGLHECENIEQAFDLLRDVTVTAADMQGDDVFETTFCGKIALVVGNEGNGLSDCTRCRADKIVSLPMSNGFESLNAAVAGSVIMYQIFLQTTKRR